MKSAYSLAAALRRFEFKTVMAVLGCGSLLALSVTAAADAPGEYSWNAPDRGTKVVKLTPGLKIPNLTPDILFADWCRGQVEKWVKAHPGESIEAACESYATSAPTDKELTADFPQHISPFARVRSGKANEFKTRTTLAFYYGYGNPFYCPFCGSSAMATWKWDVNNPWHATTMCCHREIYGRKQDYPPDYDLKPTGVAKFEHLDGTVKEAEYLVRKDPDGVEWELFIPTVFANRRWLDIANMVVAYMKKFKDTADPLYAYKIAVILDKTADTYYGLPLSYYNELAKGRDGKPLTRAEWEGVKEVNIFAPTQLGPWNRRIPTFGNRGWINAYREAIWVEPFARVRHHPAFKFYSKKLYGDPEALDRKIMTKLIAETGRAYETIFSQRLVTEYQEVNYYDLLLVGILTRNQLLADFAGPNQEATLYNHHYTDGMNGEGAENYMQMLTGYYWFMSNPKGVWLELYPDFLKDHPFFASASTELNKLRTVRNLELEFADQHMRAFNSKFMTDPAKVAEREKVPSMNWPGWGIGVLRFGGSGHRQEMTLAYTRTSRHATSDALGISCWMDGVPVMRPGGYAHHPIVPLDFNRPEIKGLNSMGYPHEIVEVRYPGWAWDWTHSPLVQNTVTVDDAFVSRGWEGNRGFGELITFKGGEASDDFGARFQVLDARDRFSFERVGVKGVDFRRTLLGIEGADGRPYALDVLSLRGGTRHTLYQSAWAERAGDALPTVAAAKKNLSEIINDPNKKKPYGQIRNVEQLAPPSGNWELTWKTDYAAYAPRNPKGGTFSRPIPENAGQVLMRLIGISQPDGLPELIRGKGPWVAVIKQPLVNNSTLESNVGFIDGTDFLIERHQLADGSSRKELTSRFVHLLEGYRSGEKSAIKRVESLQPDNPANSSSIGINVELTSGFIDTLIYQPEDGKVEFKGGMSTDARYAMIRRNGNGEVVEAHMVRGSYLHTGTFELKGVPEYSGTIVDMIGDLTGTRHESALIVRPDSPWPEAPASGCRQMLVSGPNIMRTALNEVYAIEGIKQMPGNLIRINLANHAPLVTGWHQVTLLDPKKPNVLKTNRPMAAGANTPWYYGMKAWFPARGVSTIIKSVTMDMLVAEDGFNFAANGIKPGDWYVIHFLEPGLKVTLPNAVMWRK